LIYTRYINILCFTHLMQNYNFKKDTSISLVKILHNNFYIINHEKYAGCPPGSAPAMSMTIWQGSNIKN
jgi:hypothetical protein